MTTGHYFSDAQLMFSLEQFASDNHSCVFARRPWAAMA